MYCYFCCFVSSVILLLLLHSWLLSFGWFGCFVASVAFVASVVLLLLTNSREILANFTWHFHNFQFQPSCVTFLVKAIYCLEKSFTPFYSTHAIIVVATPDLLPLNRLHLNFSGNFPCVCVTFLVYNFVPIKSRTLRKWME